MKLPPSKWDSFGGGPIIENYKSAYAQVDWLLHQHHIRLKKFLSSLTEQIECPECNGYGGHVESVLDYGQGPWFDCDFCEGLGIISPHALTMYNRWKQNA